MLLNSLVLVSECQTYRFESAFELSSNMSILFFEWTVFFEDYLNIL